MLPRSARMSGGKPIRKPSASTAWPNAATGPTANNSAGPNAVAVAQCPPAEITPAPPAFLLAQAAMVLVGAYSFEVMTDGRCLVLTPVRSAAEERKFQRALEKVHKRFGRAMKKLAE